ncbi:hypothetical protein J6I82_05245 [Acinetobacter baumannii]|uniref:Uncharacterized protein n=1 Tax=Acinetobacter baumannii TaxID=470 RepID=A0AAQ0D1S8_ACIBA|nr:hypothetical protein [Acinetobacter baumannii]MCA4424319.1 hypothetical protein [Acinetobacter baumannii]NHQ49243.1 hypothetical protein [Acinetobacter baumannii]QTH55076.1 hypothetical protein J5P21_13045 [Acinetobacter baumannii]QTK44477.1 hypothetical protein J6E47_05245 [Acinetobacter baumannii]QTK52688.1 hypothetical protein J6F37_05250 [Acinetobacter baumannii]
MKIEYLQVMHDANVGDIKEVTDFEANILIKTGVAKLFEEPKKAPSKPKKEVKTSE